MSGPQQTAVQNRLLKALSHEDFELIRPHLFRIETPVNHVLIVKDRPFSHLYFPETGFISITSESDNVSVEVGLIGREGLVGCSLLMLGVDRSPYAHFAQMGGHGFCIDSEAMQGAVSATPSLRRLLLRAVHLELIQARETAFVNATYVIEVRLARWLLMCQDRLDGNEIAITHAFLSMMLGVQRGGVTLALHNLEGAGRIRSRRGRVTVTDRDSLLDLAGASYGTSERAYAELIAAG